MRTWIAFCLFWLGSATVGVAQYNGQQFSTAQRIVHYLLQNRSDDAITRLTSTANLDKTTFAAQVEKFALLVKELDLKFYSSMGFVKGSKVKTIHEYMFYTFKDQKRQLELQVNVYFDSTITNSKATKIEFVSHDKMNRKDFEWMQKNELPLPIDSPSKQKN